MSRLIYAMGRKIWIRISCKNAHEIQNVDAKAIPEQYGNYNSVVHFFR